MKNDYPRPTVWPPPPIRPPGYFPGSPKITVASSERRLGIASACCGVAGVIGIIIFPIFTKVREGGGPYHQSYHPPLDQQISQAVLILALFLLAVGFVTGLFSWRSIGGKIGVAILGVPSVALVVAGLITVILPHLHLW